MTTYSDHEQPTATTTTPRFYVAPVENMDDDADSHAWNYWVIDRSNNSVIAEYRTLRYARREIARLNAAVGADA